MSGATVSRARIVGAARRWIGTPYVHQASLIHVGCDCLGLVRGVWRDVMGVEPEQAPPYTPDWAEALGVETLLEAAGRHFTPLDTNAFCGGDILVFRFREHLPAKHLGVATSATHMVHAHAGAAVAEITIGAHWRKQLAGAFAFPSVID